MLVDERYRNGRDESGAYVGGGWQSGLVTAGGDGVAQEKSSYAPSAALFGDGRAACTSQLVSWSPAVTPNGGPAGGGGTQAKRGKGPICKKGQRPTKRRPCRKPVRR